jgi:hypothetical protein
MEHLILAGLVTAVLAMVCLVYHAATSSCQSDEFPDPVGLYAVQIQEYRMQQRVWVTVYTGSLSACVSQRDHELYQQGHTRSTARIVQLV